MAHKRVWTKTKKGARALKEVQEMRFKELYELQAEVNSVVNIIERYLEWKEQQEVE